MARKDYSKFPNAPELEPHNQIQFNVISRIIFSVRALTIFSRPIQSPTDMTDNYEEW